MEQIKCRDAVNRMHTVLARCATPTTSQQSTVVFEGPPSVRSCSYGLRNAQHCSPGSDLTSSYCFHHYLMIRFPHVYLVSSQTAKDSACAQRRAAHADAVTRASVLDEHLPYIFHVPPALLYCRLPVLASCMQH